MSYSEFLQLDEMEQYLFMVNEGVQIARRRDHLYRYFLYQFDAFYIEVKLHLKQTVLRGLISTSATSILDKYLDKINISAAINFFK